jgi:hypothetical protein
MTSGYMKAWRKRHPHYSRDKQRMYRGQEPKDLVGRKPGRKMILGVPVRIIWCPFVSKEQANREFLALTEEK